MVVSSAGGGPFKTGVPSTVRTASWPPGFRPFWGRSGFGAWDRFAADAPGRPGHLPRDAPGFRVRCPGWLSFGEGTRRGIPGIRITPRRGPRNPRATRELPLGPCATSIRSLIFWDANPRGSRAIWRPPD